MLIHLRIKVSRDKSWSLADRFELRTPMLIGLQGGSDIWNFVKLRYISW